MINIMTMITMVMTVMLATCLWRMMSSSTMSLRAW